MHTLGGIYCHNTDDDGEQSMITTKSHVYVVLEITRHFYLMDVIRFLKKQCFFCIK